MTNFKHLKKNLCQRCNWPLADNEERWCHTCYQIIKDEMIDCDIEYLRLQEYENSKEKSTIKT